jgi:hypothetical protein
MKRAAEPNPDEPEFSLIDPDNVKALGMVSEMKECVFFTEATNDQKEAAFTRYSTYGEPHMQSAYDRRCNPKFDWTMSMSSTSFDIGYIMGIKKAVVLLRVSIDDIGGHKVCFYNACGRYVDHDLVEAWINTYFVKETYQKRGDVGDMVHYLNKQRKTK